MIRFILQRLLTAIPTLLVIATLAFMLLHLTPGGPFDSDKLLVPQIQRSIEAHYHLDEPLWRQYLRYLNNLARGDRLPAAAPTLARAPGSQAAAASASTPAGIGPGARSAPESRGRRPA